MRIMESFTIAQTEQPMPTDISEHEIILITAALPNPQNSRKRALLPMIVRAWFTEQVPTLLQRNQSGGEGAAVRKQAKEIAKAATQLSKQIEDAETGVHAAIVDALTAEIGL